VSASATFVALLFGVIGYLVGFAVGQARRWRRDTGGDDRRPGYLGDRRFR